MQVNMEDGLTRFRVAVEDGPITGPVVSLVPSDLRGGADHGADQAIVTLVEVVERGNMLLRYDQHMQRRLRVDIGERQQPIVFVDLRRRNLTGHDAAEQTAQGTIFLSTTATRGMRC